MTTRSHVTTHVLDASVGRPAAGVPVALELLENGVWVAVGRSQTDADGRANALGPDQCPPGRYRLSFDTLSYFSARGVNALYPEVHIVFELADTAAHYHVPLLLSPFAYSTYLGS